MTDIASLALEVKSDQVLQANVALREMVPAASAAERAAQKWGLTANAASQSTEDFSRRVQGTIRNLEFERQQLTRNAAEQERHLALRRAGVTATSAEGQAISAAVLALQAQRAATKGAAEATTLHGAAAKTATNAATELVTHLKYLALAYVSVEGARKLFEIGLKAGDFGEQAEQIGVNTDQLQAYRLAGAQAGIETEQMDTAIMKLARSMGSANDGNKEMIELFQKLKVNLLDAKGELRPTSDVLPELARGLQNIGSSSEKTATLMTLFGRSGAKMATVLGDISKGNDAVIETARKQNGIVGPEAIEAWDRLGDRMKVSEQRFKTLIAEFGASTALPAIDYLNGMLEGTKKELEAIQNLWKWIMGNMDAAARRSASAAGVPFQNDVAQLQDQLTAARQRQAQFRPGSTGFNLEQGSVSGLEKRIEAAQEASRRMGALVNQTVMQLDEADARSGKLPISAPPLGVTEGGTKGVGNPTPKGQVEAYEKLIANAKQYIALKKAETEGIGMNAEAAARLKHEQELLGKAAEGNIAIGPKQTAQIKELAAAMADADAKFGAAKFMDDAAKKSKELIAAQEIERNTLFMSTEAAAAYRYEQELLNKAANDNIILTDMQKQALAGLAGQMAASEERTRRLKDLFDFGRDAVKGFFSDMRSGLQQGQSAWEAFGNAVNNVLNKIADKLVDMAVNQLFSAAFGGSSGGGGASAAGGMLGSLLSGGGSSGGPLDFIFTALMGSPFMANGGVFNRGNVVPFAHGGVVNRPTLFPMANGGAGVMGEAGPEGILPLRRGGDGRLGVSAHGMQGRAPIIRLEVAGDNEWVRAVARDESGQVIAAVGPDIENRAVKRAGKQVVPTMNRAKAWGGGDYRVGG